MIDYAVSRALQMSDLTPQEILELHRLEEKAGHCLPNDNIQTLFKKRSLKETYCIPDDKCAYHNNKIRAQLEDKLKIPPYMNDLRVEDVHSFDWEVDKERGSIIWEFSAGKLNALKKKLMEVHSL